MGQSPGDADHREGGGRRRRSGATCRRSRRSIRSRELKPGATALLTGIRRARPRAGRAGVPALRPRQVARHCRCRTPGCGGCTRRWTVEGSDAPHVLAAADALARGRRAGSRDGRRRRPTACRRGEPVTLTAEVVGSRIQGHQRRPDHRAASRRRRARSKTCRWSGRSSTTANTARASRRPRTASTRSPSAARPRTARTSAAARVNLRVAPSDAEYFDAAMRAPLLQRHRRRDRRPVLPRRRRRRGWSTRSRYSGKGITVVEEKELWDMPIILLLLLGLMGGEWMFRGHGGWHERFESPADRGRRHGDDRLGRSAVAAAALAQRGLLAVRTAATCGTTASSSSSGMSYPW